MPYPTEAPKVCASALNWLLAVICIGAVLNEASPMQVWAQPADGAAPSRAKMAMRVRCMTVSDVRSDAFGDENAIGLQLRQPDDPSHSVKVLGAPGFASPSRDGFAFSGPLSCGRAELSKTRTKPGIK